MIPATKLAVLVLVCCLGAVGQQIVAISPGQVVVCVVPDKKYKFHFTHCDLVTHYIVTPGGEPLDVPAIQETRTSFVDCNVCTENSCTSMYCPHSKEVKEQVWTCADKARILEHDEQTPPKYWCRKVQP